MLLIFYSGAPRQVGAAGQQTSEGILSIMDCYRLNNVLDGLRRHLLTAGAENTNINL